MSEKAVGGWLPLIGEAIECASPKPPLSGEVARRNAETERLLQICDDLSVTFGDSSPERGALGACKSIRNPMQKGAA